MADVSTTFKAGEGRRAWGIAACSGSQFNEKPLGLSDAGLDIRGPGGAGRGVACASIQATERWVGNRRPTPGAGTFKGRASQPEVLRPREEEATLRE